MKRTVLTLLAGLLIGAAVGRWTVATRPLPPPEKNPAGTRDAAAEELLARSAQEISSAPDTETRQKRIEDLLQKIFKLFMIDVSLRLQALEKNPEPVPSTDAASSAAVASSS
ncbi:MAG TPA: hypothetical protein PL182_09150, partial [Pseudobdellovibrionaceae bacterium]|nr:hypothetical protein [Pseudobdellovibrionaceae bacterium]